MKRINSFEEFNMLSEGIMAGTTGIMGEPKLNKAAELIGSYINRKVGGDLKSSHSLRIITEFLVLCSIVIKMTLHFV